MSGTPQTKSLTLRKTDFKRLKIGAPISALRVQGPGELRQVDVEFNEKTLEVWLNIDSQDTPKVSPDRTNTRGFRSPRPIGWYVSEFAEASSIFTLSYTPSTPVTFNRMLEIKVRNPQKVASAKITSSFVFYYLSDPTPELREPGEPQPRVEEDDI